MPTCAASVSGADPARRHAGRSRPHVGWGRAAFCGTHPGMSTQSSGQAAVVRERSRRADGTFGEQRFARSTVDLDAGPSRSPGAAVQEDGQRIAAAAARVPGAAFAVLGWDRYNSDDHGNTALAFSAFVREDGSRINYLDLDAHEHSLAAMDAAEQNLDDAADDVEAILESIDLEELDRAGGSSDVGVFRTRHTATPGADVGEFEPRSGGMPIAYLVPAAERGPGEGHGPASHA